MLPPVLDELDVLEAAPEDEEDDELLDEPPESVVPESRGAPESAVVEASLPASAGAPASPPPLTVIGPPMFEWIEHW